jgi:hypothetical protein
MLYVGLAAVNKAREGNDTPPAHNSGATFIENAGDIPDLFMLALQHNPAADDAIKEEQEVTVMPVPSWLITFFIPETGPGRNFSSYSLFSRPPPRTY